MEFNSELKIAIVGWLEKVMTMENKLPTSLSLSLKICIIMDNDLIGTVINLKVLASLYRFKTW